MSDRPELRCLIGWAGVGNYVWIRRDLATLEKALDYQRAGFMVLVDPETEAELARWEQINSRKPKRWNRW